MGRVKEMTPEREAFCRDVIRQMALGHGSESEKSGQTFVAKQLETTQQSISRILKGDGVTIAMALKMADKGWIRINPLLDGDLVGADVSNPAPSCVNASDVQRLRAALRELQDVIARLP